MSVRLTDKIAKLRGETMITKKGKKIMKAMKEKYGSKKGEQVFYASKNKGTITGVEKGKKKKSKKKS
jgi:hypothetical protein